MKRPLARATGLSLLLPVVILAGLGWHRRWVAEDAFINLRVVENLLAGHGPVFNLGERVEIYTSPLWLAVVGATAALFRSLRPEWIAAGLALAASCGGLLLAGMAARLLARKDGGEEITLPLGGLVVAAIPAYWDFATSGLETGLCLAWLAGCFWGLVRVHRALDRGVASDGPAWVAVAVGLGPLIRPDFAVFSAGFFAIVLAHARPRLAGYARLALAAIAIPALYQIFRMGYFAALVPNPALAKEAFAARWDQGWRYVADFAGVYALWVPGVPLFLWWLRDVAGSCRSRQWRAAVLLTVPVACGVLHGAYIVRVGGDFMHGRLLLPSLFAALLPVAVITGARYRHAMLATLVIVPWAFASALWFRVPHAGTGYPEGIADERAFYVKHVGPNPVTLTDYGQIPWTQDALALRRLAGERRALVLGEWWDPPRETALAAWVVADVVAGRRNVGVAGYAAGPRVHLVDRYGLGDPLAGRLRLDQRRRPGHEKELSDAWIVARFADPAAPLPPGGPPPDAVSAARTALGCEPLRKLLRAVEAPLTGPHFLRNLASAWQLHRLVIPADPREAATRLCPSTLAVPQGKHRANLDFDGLAP